MLVVLGGENPRQDADITSQDARAKGKGSAPATGTRTSPRITRNPYASGSAGGPWMNCNHNPYAAKNATGPAPLTSGGISATARSLSFATPPDEQGQSVKKDPSTTVSGEKRHLTVANLSQQKKKIKQGGEGDGDISVGDDKDDKDIDFVAITDNAMETDNQETGSSGRDDILHGIKLRH